MSFKLVYHSQCIKSSSFSLTLFFDKIRLLNTRKETRNNNNNARTSLITSVFRIVAMKKNFNIISLPLPVSLILQGHLT